MTIPNFRKHIDKKLLTRFWLFLIVCAIFLSIIVYDLIHQNVSVFVAIIGLIIGFAIGELIGRQSKYSWDHGNEKVVSGLDAIGIFILCLYILFALNKNLIFGQFVHGESLAVLVLSITAGTLLGRVTAMRRGIRTILVRAGIAPENKN